MKIQFILHRADCLHVTSNTSNNRDSFKFKTVWLKIFKVLNRTTKDLRRSPRASPLVTLDWSVQLSLRMDFDSFLNSQLLEILLSLLSSSYFHWSENAPAVQFSVQYIPWIMDHNTLQNFGRKISTSNLLVALEHFFKWSRKFKVLPQMKLSDVSGKKVSFLFWNPKFGSRFILILVHR